MSDLKEIYFYNRFTTPKIILKSDNNNINIIDNLKNFKNNDSDNLINLDNYYKNYPQIEFNESDILNNVYNIKNIDDLKKWLKNNEYNNFLNLNRVLDYGWKVFIKEIYINESFFTNYYLKIYKKKYKKIQDKELLNYINEIFKKYDISNLFSFLLEKNIYKHINIK